MENGKLKLKLMRNRQHLVGNHLIWVYTLDYDDIYYIGKEINENKTVNNL